jgi:[CysO sulfur-carrier protein]-S-L-cysteine hydrolase
VVIGSAIRDELIAHARGDAPNECCGMVGGIDGRATSVYRAVNERASPLSYSIEPGDLFRILRAIEEAGEELVAIYHSHTKSPAYPSPTDVNLATGWPDPVYLIVSIADPNAPEVRGFHLRDGEVEEVELVDE